MSKSKVINILVPYIKKLAEDKSWRIRYVVADKIMELVQGIGQDHATEHLLPSFSSLLKDTESEVRTAAVNRI